MKVKLYSQNGKASTKEVELLDTVFAAKINEKVLSQYVYVYLSNQRQSNAHTKDRSEVSGGGRKPWRQKGTGRARSGSSRSPIWRSGGVTFGPTNDRNYKRKITKNTRKAAYRSAFSKLLKEEMLNIVGEMSFDAKQLTKQAVGLVKSFGAGKMTIIIAANNETLFNAFSNVPNVKVTLVSELSVYDLLTGGKVLLMQDALEYINAKWDKAVVTKEAVKEEVVTAKPKKVTKK